jgi:hypothetical protein
MEEGISVARSLSGFDLCPRKKWNNARNDGGVPVAVDLDLLAILEQDEGVDRDCED